MRDDDLRARFSALRQQDHDDAPTFAEMLARARSRQPEERHDRWSWGVFAAAIPAIAVVALALGVLDLDKRGETADSTGLEAWSAPTSGLVADLGAPDDPLTALESFQSPTAGLLDLDNGRTP